MYTGRRLTAMRVPFNNVHGEERLTAMRVPFNNVYGEETYSNESTI